jgi:peroxiredoxin
MKASLYFLTGLLVMFFAVSTVSANDKATVGQAAPEFTLVDSNGNEHSLSDFRGQFVVLEWLNHDCPFVRKFYNAGKMQELQEYYTGKGVVWLSIISSREGEQGHMTPAQINQANADKNVFATAVLIDEPGTVGRMYDARTTPHMFVINPDGVLLYDGAIDNKPTANPADIEGAENYVVAALNAAMNGEAVAVSTTRPYGCSVKY